MMEMSSLEYSHSSAENWLQTDSSNLVGVASPLENRGYHQSIEDAKPNDNYSQLFFFALAD